MSTITVRPLTLADYDGVRRVNERVQRQYRGAMWDSLTAEAKDEYLVSRASEFTINVGTGLSFVAVLDDQIIGFVFAYETLPFRGGVYVHYIAVDPEYQGQGVGLLLYARLAEKARAEGMREVFSTINSDNPRSMRMHEKAGFTLYDSKEAVLKL